MRWEGHVAHVEMRNVHEIVTGNLRGRDHLGELEADGGITLKWVIKK
jgi:hypothetical protein